MPDERRIHVTKHEDGWAATREGAKRAIQVSETKEAVIDRGREIAKKEGGELVIHKQKRNEIQEERTYRKDPYPPRG
jgi:Uncharacterized protein conserved in bacteria (DUF2188)